MHTFHYRWTFPSDAPAEALWPFVADTSRFNRDTAVPAVESTQGAAPLQNGRRRLHLRRFGVPIEWEEEPFEWVRPFRFGVTRTYLRGPVAEMRVLAQLTPREGGGTILTYDVWARPRNLFGYLAIPAEIGVLSGRRFKEVFRRYSHAAGVSAPQAILPLHVELAPGGAQRMAQLRQKLLEQGADPDLLGRLIDLIGHGDDLDVFRLRPYALADSWSVPRRAVLELCLWAARAGLLDLRWDVVCPLCRGSKSTSSTLRDMPAAVHCDSCNIDFGPNFDRLVELTFRPNSGIRPLDVGEFCVGGPNLTPHVAVQQLLPAGADRSVTTPLEEGRYRIRTLALPGAQLFSVGPDGESEVTLRAGEDGWPAGELQLSPTPTLHFVNATDSEQLFILERMRWSDQAATAAEVTALQVFRDLFSSEAIRPGEPISVGSLAIVFTDVRGSTQLYRQIGDPTAFGRVMSHFDILREAIKQEDGAVVKTIGDAVMGAFQRPASALRAILRAQQMLAISDLDPLLVIRAGIHYGPCIAVTMNDRLDYFGSTVNLAARLEGVGLGGDVVISDAVRVDPEIQQMLAESGGMLEIEQVESSLKGFDDRFPLWRIRSRMPATSAVSNEDPGTGGVASIQA